MLILILDFQKRRRDPPVEDRPKSNSTRRHVCMDIIYILILVQGERRRARFWPRKQRYARKRNVRPGGEPSSHTVRRPCRLHNRLQRFDYFDDCNYRYQERGDRVGFHGRVDRFTQKNVQRYNQVHRVFF